MKIKKNRLLPCLISSISLSLCSCASMSDSIMLGIGSGAAAGVAIANQGQKDSGSGAAVGALVGGLSAYFIHKGIQNREERVRRETLLNLEKYDVSAPTKGGSVTIPTGGGHFLTKPVVDMEWMETQVQGDKLVEGHRVWRIVEKPKWIPSNEPDGESKK